ncbi:MAG TPA: biotin-dependent carboxyltransferase family protein [Candidatus Limnocylindrales bacterium]|nr:biotin-dependent carboxyltransferase family protein [Candidatus Limnocylindrales bacterium]
MSPEAVFRVVEAGLQATIQDAGRPGLGALGVPRSGACDPMGLAVANLLVGNRPDAPVLECAIAGPELLVLRDVVVGLAGADLGAVARPSGRRLGIASAHALEAGERLVLAGSGPGSGSGSGSGSGPRSGPVTRTGSAGAGCRAYLAVPGGFAAATVLGSASTSLVGGFGGLDGRPLRVGDELLAVGPGLDDRRLAGHRWPADLALPQPGDAAAILAGPAAEGEAGGIALATLVGMTWRVAAASDRRGLRLEGPALGLAVPSDGPSHGVPTGTIQVAPSGLPMVLLPDAGPTGGYPILAIVASADRSIPGQARPGGTIRFRLVDIDAARAAERDRRHVLEAGAARLGMTDPWDDLPDLAGA